MSSYEQVVAKLGWPKRVCLGGCGVTTRSHRTGFIFLDVVHFEERRVTRKGLRRFFLLLARRNREADPTYLNDPQLGWYHLWADEQYANALAQVIGVRFPVEFSRTERWRCLWLAHKVKVPITRTHPALYSWAIRGLDR